MIDNSEYVAERLHTTMQRLAPRFMNGRTKSPVAPMPWSDTPAEYQRMMVAVVRAIFQEMPSGGDPQHLEFDRNHWQRKVGALLEMVEQYSRLADVLRTDGTHDMTDVEAVVRTGKTLHTHAHRIVNTNWYTSKPMDDPHADIAQLTYQETLRMAVRSGMVIPSANAPEWLKSVIHPSPDDA